MGFKKALLGKGMLPFQKLLSKSSKINSLFLDGIKSISYIKTKYGPIKLSTNNALTYFRANTFFSKEPDTLAWIDTFNKSDTFYDIGANVGLYSLYAAIKGISVLAFEPESQNYAEFNKNIFLNNLDSKIQALNVAISDKNSINYLNLSNFGTGYALHNFGENVDFNKQKFKPAMRQSVCSYSLDVFIEKFNLLHPNYIKIDVDGLEKEIVVGAKKTLMSKQTYSVLIELNMDLESDKQIYELLLTYGYSVISKYQPLFITERFKNIFNFIFSRKEI